MACLLSKFPENSDPVELFINGIESLAGKVPSGLGTGFSGEWVTPALLRCFGASIDVYLYLLVFRNMVPPS
jgi:hypothetical protein